MLFDDPDDSLIDESVDMDVAGEPEGLLEPREAISYIGHKAVELQLRGFIASGKMPHALVFSGPAGIGKATMAFRLAKFLMAQKTQEEAGPSLFGDAEPPAMTASGVLEGSLDIDPEEQGARLVSSGGHPDLLTLMRKEDEKTGVVRESLDVEQIRSVGPFLTLTPFMGGWRVVIVDDADTMTRSSQNALLKVLEEPPANTLLVLIAHRIGNLIPTIRSRSRVIAFNPLSVEDFAILAAKAGIGQKDVDSLYNISGGSIGAALRLYQNGALKAFEQVTSLLTQLPRPSRVDVHNMGNVLNVKGQGDGMQGFQDVLMWSIGEIIKARAKNHQDLPAPLDNAAYQELMNAYSLERWSKIWENLNAHFAMVKYGSLDRRQAIFGAFSILKEAS